jgi:hypothetical protein
VLHRAGLAGSCSPPPPRRRAPLIRHLACLQVKLKLKLTGVGDIYLASVSSKQRATPPLPPLLLLPSCALRGSRGAAAPEAQQGGRALGLPCSAGHAAPLGP